MKKTISAVIFCTLFSFFSFFPLSKLFAVSYEDACNVMKAENIISGDFIQKRTIASNGKTLKSYGVFTVSSEKIIWETTKPVKNTVTITMGKLTQTDSRGKTTQLDGTENPMFFLVTKMISSLFSGNKEELEQYFEVDFESNSESELWTMKLFPKDSMLSQGIQSIILCGNTKVLNSMQTIQVTGDSILYEFLNQRQ